MSGFGFWISGASTRADSSFQGMEFPGPWGISRSSPALGSPAILLLLLIIILISVIDNDTNLTIIDDNIYYILIVITLQARLPSAQLRSAPSARSARALLALPSAPAKPRRATKEGQWVLRTTLHIRTLVFLCSAWF